MNKGSRAVRDREAWRRAASISTVMTLRSLGNTEGTAFGRAIDGRYSAQKYDVPGVIGYGPTLRHARDELVRRLASLRDGLPIGAVLTVRRDRNRLWTARL